MPLSSRLDRDDDPLALENQIDFSFYAASHAMTKAYRPYLIELGVTYPQYLVLICLWKEDGLNITALGNILALDTGTVTPIIKRMELLGYLTRVRDVEDERHVHVCLTREGSLLRDRAIGFQTELRVRMKMDEKEIIRMRSAIMSLVSNLTR